MAKCKRDAILAKVQPDRLNDQSEIAFSVLTSTNDCMKINAKDYIGYHGETASYNRYNSPADMFNCLAEGCKNSGTLMLKNAAGSNVGAKYTAPFDATDFSAGIITFYAYFETAGTYDVTVTLSDVADIAQANAYVYAQTVTVDEGFRPILIDLSQVPTSQVGTGWDITENGATINADIINADPLAIPSAGISSFFFYNSLSEFVTNAVVKIGCLTEVARSLSVDALETQCAQGGYDSTSVAIEFTVTGNKVTPNYYLLNPLIQKSEETTGWIDKSIEKTIESTTIGGVEYGYVQILDMSTDECGFVGAQIADQCNITDSELERVGTPILADINERQFIVLDGIFTQASDAGKFIFNKALVGNKVIVSYPQVADVETFDITDEALNSRRARMVVSACVESGVKEVSVYNNVLITSFPGTINREETVFEFTISIQKDRNGNYGKMQVVRD